MLTCPPQAPSCPDPRASRIPKVYTVENLNVRGFGLENTQQQSMG